MSNLIDFHKETLEDIERSGHTIGDIAYVSLEGRNFKPEKFLERIKGIKYNAGYGVQKINPSLEIVFKDGTYLIRQQVRGCEWWYYVPVKLPGVELEDFPENAVIKDENHIW